MKNSPSDILKTELATFNALKQETETLRTQLATAQADLESLSINGDLNDKNVLSSIGRQQIFTSLLPTRITARETAITEAEAGLLKFCHTFIRASLGPRLRDLSTRARAKVAAVLKQHLQDFELERAVENSNEVAEIESFSHVATIRDYPAGEVVPYAERLLNAWNQAENFADKL